MSKELKSFEIIKKMYKYFVKKYRDLEPKLMICEKEDFDNVENALKEYEGAKNHIEALHKEIVENSIKIKALDIIKETRVDTNLIKLSKDYDDYCSMEAVKILNNGQTTKQKGIAQNEFDILKEVLL